MKLRKMLTGIASATIAATVLAVNAGAYTAWLNFQTATYSFRNEYNSKEYGVDSPYYNNIIVWGDEEDEEDDFDYDLGGNLAEGTFTNAEITGDGTYTVSLTDCDWERMNQSFNLIFFSSDIPLGGAVFTDVTLTVDGTDVYTFAEGYQKSDQKDITQIMCVNTYDNEMPISPLDVPAPTESMAITFTVSGLGSAAEEAAVETAAVVEETTTAPATGNTSTAASSDKGSADTGVEGVAVVVGLALLAAGAVVISRKRK